MFRVWRHSTLFTHRLLHRRRTLQQCLSSVDNGVAIQRVADSLQRNGYGVYPSRIISESTCRALHHRIPKLFAGEFETGVYPDEWHWRYVRDNECRFLYIVVVLCDSHLDVRPPRQGISKEEGVTREMCNVWKSDRLVASIILQESLGKLVCNIMGWPSARIAQDDLIWKPPLMKDVALLDDNNSVVGFHQDSAYISNQFDPQDNNSVTVWMALDDADEETGCVQYVPGSHLWVSCSVDCCLV